jgi:hypothetical protein
MLGPLFYLPAILLWLATTLIGGALIGRFFTSEHVFCSQQNGLEEMKQPRLLQPKWGRVQRCFLVCASKV